MQKPLSRSLTNAPTPISACYFQYNLNATATAHLGQTAHFPMKITVGPHVRDAVLFPDSLPAFG